MLVGELSEGATRATQKKNATKESKPGHALRCLWMLLPVQRDHTYLLTYFCVALANQVKIYLPLFLAGFFFARHRLPRLNCRRKSKEPIHAGNGQTPIKKRRLQLLKSRSNIVELSK